MGDLEAGAIDLLEIRELTENGCRIEIVGQEGRLRFTAIAADSSTFSIESTDAWTDIAFTEEEAIAAALAATAGDVAGVLDNIPPDTTLQVKLMVDPSAAGFYWVRTQEVLMAQLSGASWLDFVRLVSSTIEGNVPHLVVLSAGTALISCEGLVVHGPEVWPENPSPNLLENLPTLSGGAQQGAPVPASVSAIQYMGSELDETYDILLRLAATLVWLWLADRAEVDGRRILISFEGNRVVQGDLPLCPVGEDPAASIALWAWVVSVPDAGRRIAVAHALALQVESTSDLYNRAGSVMDAAQFLHSVAQRGLLQEALAARRAARDAGVAAAANAAERARSAARTAVDRLLLVLAAAVGVVIANRGELVSTPFAVALIVLAVLLAVGAGVLLFAYELPGANRYLNSFESDLETHASEDLLPKDIEALKQLPSLSDSRQELEKARTMGIAVVVSAIAAFLIFGGIVTLSDTSVESPTTTVRSRSQSTESVPSSVETTIPPRISSVPATPGAPSAVPGSSTSSTKPGLGS